MACALFNRHGRRDSSRVDSSANACRPRSAIEVPDRIRRPFDSRRDRTQPHVDVPAHDEHGRHEVRRASTRSRRRGSRSRWPCLRRTTPRCVLRQRRHDRRQSARRHTSRNVSSVACAPADNVRARQRLAKRVVGRLVDGVRRLERGEDVARSPDDGRREPTAIATPIRPVASAPAPAQKKIGGNQARA